MGQHTHFSLSVCLPSTTTRRLMKRLAFPGNCKDKTGSDPKKFSSEYKDFLGKSFETQTWVYEQAVR
jgi:hypothetical protein